MMIDDDQLCYVHALSILKCFNISCKQSTISCKLYTIFASTNKN